MPWRDSPAPARGSAVESAVKNEDGISPEMAKEESKYDKMRTKSGPPPQLWIRTVGNTWELCASDVTVEIMTILTEWRIQECEHLGIPYEGSALTKD